jgi:hypothetical protein
MIGQSVAFEGKIANACKTAPGRARSRFPVSSSAASRFGGTRSAAH